MTNSSQQTRSSLLQRARDDDSQAWEQLRHLYGPLVEDWCRRCGLDWHSTADCVQDVFLAVSTHLVDFAPRRSHGSFRAWLWSITLNKLRDHARRSGRSVAATGGSTAQQLIAQVPDAYDLPDEEPSEDGQLKELTRRAVNQIRGEFEPRTWQAFWRSAVDGIPTAVTADELGMSISAVRQSRSRILRRLRQHLGDSD